MTTPLPTSTLKREIIKIYNEVNQEMYAVGVRQQRVDLLGDKILIMAEHQRVTALRTLDETHRWLTRMVDAALLEEYKSRTAARIEALLGIGVRTVLKDYDPVTQMAGTVILLDSPLSVD